MSFELRRTYRFEAAHWLPRVPEGHRCRSIHGHSYELEIELGGELDPELGWVLDYAAIDAVVAPLVDLLDHVCLNEVEGLENPTSELLARWVHERVSGDLRGLQAVTVRETPTSAAVYRTLA